MAKKVVAIVKLQCPAGQANPSPPVGPALGQHGVNIMEFCKAFNARTQDKAGLIIPAIIHGHTVSPWFLILFPGFGLGTAQPLAVSSQETRTGPGHLHEVTGTSLWIYIRPASL